MAIRSPYLLFPPYRIANSVSSLFSLFVRPTVWKAIFLETEIRSPIFFLGLISHVPLKSSLISYLPLYSLLYLISPSTSCFISYLPIA